ncbi:nucleotidyl cyclase domain-containing protein [Actinomadura napierensis]|uniref:Guanylate cyclase domain-containing protein n=1 Tax=Actinomadura napierensis TaxID=267854 RepID=A0ABN3AIB4_9ACTN
MPVPGPDAFTTHRSVTASRPAPWRPIFSVDIAGFGSSERDDEAHVAVRERLYQVLRESWDKAGLSWTEAIREDRGDGVLLIACPDEPPALLIDPLLELIRARLQRHNKLSSTAGRIRLRAALHLGPVVRDNHGVTGTSVNHLFRLLDSPQLREALDEPNVDLAFIASQQVYDSVILTHGSLAPDNYLPVECRVKETVAPAWITIPVRCRRPRLTARAPASQVSFRSNGETAGPTPKTALLGGR